MNNIWIRTQDRNSIINCTCNIKILASGYDAKDEFPIRIVSVHNYGDPMAVGNHIEYNIDESYRTLGKYSTIEAAQNILDEIEAHINSGKTTIYNMPQAKKALRWIKKL